MPGGRLLNNWSYDKADVFLGSHYQAPYRTDNEGIVLPMIELWHDLTYQTLGNHGLHRVMQDFYQQQCQDLTLDIQSGSEWKPYPNAEHSPKDLCCTVFGPKNVEYESLES